jgi:hypothetical protein
MRELISTKEFYGTLHIDDNVFNEVRCVYKDDYFSNKHMKGKFYLTASAEFINKLGHKVYRFKFTDSHDHMIKGRTIGFQLLLNDNPNNLAVFFKAEQFYECNISNYEVDIMEFAFHIPYIDDLSGYYQISNYESGNYSMNIGSKSISINTEIKSFMIVENIYCREFEDPDSILTKEMLLTTQSDVKGKKIEFEFFRTESLANDLMRIISFVFESRVNTFACSITLKNSRNEYQGYVTRKSSRFVRGKDILKSSDHRLKKLVDENLINNLAAGFFSKCLSDMKAIRKLIAKYISVHETEIFEIKFLAAFALVLSISKYIARDESKKLNDKKRSKDELLIEKALDISKLPNEDFAPSIEREKASICNWEMTLFRHAQAHFNDLEFDSKLMRKEFEKLMKLNRKLLAWVINPAYSYLPNTRGK